jgi:hypothetical protein
LNTWSITVIEPEVVPPVPPFVARRDWLAAVSNAIVDLYNADAAAHLHPHIPGSLPFAKI